MNYETDRVLVQLDTMKKVKAGLAEIKILSEDDEIKNKAEELIQLLEKQQKIAKQKGETLIETIYNKMKSTRDKDLNVKLYMLYRKLEDDKISEDEALKLFEIFTKTEYNEGYI